MPTPIKTEKAPAAVGPYSQGMISGNLVFVSGQLPIVAETGRMSENIKEQARASLENVKAVLEAAGSSMDRVIKTTVFLNNIEDFAAVNEVYASYFGEPFPARSCCEVSCLPKDALVEIEVMAEK